MKNLGLFGGTFDPVHHGHLMIAQAALDELALDRLFFIPASRSPFKPERVPAPAAERVRLLRLALAGKTWCEVDEQELRRGGLSFTVDTLRDYAGRFPGARLFYLIGADQVPYLSEWREPAELARLVEFVVAPRPGDSPAPFSPPFRGQVLKGFPLGVSSSQLRQRVKDGLPIDHLTPPMVAEAIRNNHLYL